MKQVISLLVYCFLLLGCYDADPRSIGSSLKRRTSSSYLITASEPEKDQTATENLDYVGDTEELEESTLIGSESVAHKASRSGSTMAYNMTHHNMPVGRHLTAQGRGTELTTVSEEQQDTESDITATFMYDVNEMNGTEDIVTTMAFIDGNLTKSGVSWVTSEDIELINTISENPDTATYMYNANELSSAQSIQTTNSNDVIYAIEEDTTTSQTTEISSTQDLVSTLFALTSDTKTTGIEKTTTMGFNPEETRQYSSTSKARDASQSGTINDVLSNVNHDTTAIDHRFTTHVHGKSMLSKVTSKLASPATSSTTAAADRTTPSQSKPQPSMARSKAQYLSLLQSDQAVAEVESQPTEIEEVADTVKPNNPTNLTSSTKLTTSATSISRTHSSSKTTDNTSSKNNKHISQSRPTATVNATNIYVTTLPSDGSTTMMNSKLNTSITFTNVTTTKKKKMEGMPPYVNDINLKDGDILTITYNFFRKASKILSYSFYKTDYYNSSDSITSMRTLWILLLPIIILML